MSITRSKLTSKTESPDTVALPDFMMSNEHLPCPLERAKNPFTCGISGRTFTALEQKERVDILKRQLKKEMGWEVNQGSEWDKVVGIYAFNTVSDD